MRLILNGQLRQGRSQQLELFAKISTPQKPQITSIEGISPKERNRYRVVLGERILGDRLTLDQALELAKLNTHKNTLS